MWTGDAQLQQRAALSLGAYGAVILSFLGGVKWGIVLNGSTEHQWRELTLSVLPSIVAWMALLLPGAGTLLLLAAALLGQYWLDFLSVRHGDLPRWFGKLRIVLTVGAVLSLVGGLVRLMTG